MDLGIDAGAEFGFGIEGGSKVMSLTEKKGKREGRNQPLRKRNGTRSRLEDVSYGNGTLEAL